MWVVQPRNHTDFVVVHAVYARSDGSALINRVTILLICHLVSELCTVTIQSFGELHCMLT